MVGQTTRLPLRGALESGIQHQGRKQKRPVDFHYNEIWMPGDQFWAHKVHFIHLSLRTRAT